MTGINKRPGFIRRDPFYKNGSIKGDTEKSNGKENPKEEINEKAIVKNNTEQGRVIPEELTQEQAEALAFQVTGYSRGHIVHHEEPAEETPAEETTDGTETTEVQAVDSNVSEGARGSDGFSDIGTKTEYSKEELIDEGITSEYWIEKYFDKVGDNYALKQNLTVEGNSINSIADLRNTLNLLSFEEYLDKEFSNEAGSLWNEFKRHGYDANYVNSGNGYAFGFDEPKNVFYHNLASNLGFASGGYQYGFDHNGGQATNSGWLTLEPLATDLINGGYVTKKEDKDYTVEELKTAVDRYMTDLAQKCGKSVEDLSFQDFIKECCDTQPKVKEDIQDCQIRHNIDASLVFNILGNGETDCRELFQQLVGYGGYGYGLSVNEYDPGIIVQRMLSDFIYDLEPMPSETDAGRTGYFLIKDALFRAAGIDEDSMSVDEKASKMRAYLYNIEEERGKYNALSVYDLFDYMINHGELEELSYTSNELKSIYNLTDEEIDKFYYLENGKYKAKHNPENVSDHDKDVFEKKLRSSFHGADPYGYYVINYAENGLYVSYEENNDYNTWLSEHGYDAATQDPKALEDFILETQPNSIRAEYIRRTRKTETEYSDFRDALFETILTNFDNFDINNESGSPKLDDLGNNEAITKAFFDAHAEELQRLSKEDQDALVEKCLKKLTNNSRKIVLEPWIRSLVTAMGGNVINQRDGYYDESKHFCKMGLLEFKLNDNIYRLYFEPVDGLTEPVHLDEQVYDEYIQFLHNKGYSEDEIQDILSVNNLERNNENNVDRLLMADTITPEFLDFLKEKYNITESEIQALLSPLTTITNSDGEVQVLQYSLPNIYGGEHAYNYLGSVIYSLQDLIYFLNNRDEDTQVQNRIVTDSRFESAIKKAKDELNGHCRFSGIGTGIYINVPENGHERAPEAAVSYIYVWDNQSGELINTGVPYGENINPNDFADENVRNLVEYYLSLPPQGNPNTIHKTVADEPTDSTETNETAGSRNVEFEEEVPAEEPVETNEPAEGRNKVFSNNRHYENYNGPDRSDILFHFGFWNSLIGADYRVVKNSINKFVNFIGDYFGVSDVYRDLTPEQVAFVNNNPSLFHMYLAFEGQPGYDGHNEIWATDDTVMNDAQANGYFMTSDELYYYCVEGFKEICRDSAEVGGNTNFGREYHPYYEVYKKFNAVDTVTPKFNVKIEGNTVEFTDNSIQAILTFLKGDTSSSEAQAYMSMFGFTKNDDETTVRQKINAFCQSLGSDDGMSVHVEDYYLALSEAGIGGDTYDECVKTVNELVKSEKSANTRLYMSRVGNPQMVEENKERLRSAIERNKKPYTAEDYADFPIYMVDITVGGTVTFGSKFKNALKTYLENVCSVSVGKIDEANNAGYYWGYTSAPIQLGWLLEKFGINYDDLDSTSYVQNGDDYTISEETFDAVINAILDKIGAKDGKMSYDQYYEFLVYNDALFERREVSTHLSSIVNDYFGYDYYVVSPQVYDYYKEGTSANETPAGSRNVEFEEEVPAEKPADETPTVGATSETDKVTGGRLNVQSTYGISTVEPPQNPSYEEFMQMLVLSNFLNIDFESLTEEYDYWDMYVSNPEFSHRPLSGDEYVAKPFDFGLDNMGQYKITKDNYQAFVSKMQWFNLDELKDAVMEQLLDYSHTLYCYEANSNQPFQWVEQLASALGGSLSVELDLPKGGQGENYHGFTSPAYLDMMIGEDVYRIGFGVHDNINKVMPHEAICSIEQYQYLVENDVPQEVLDLFFRPFNYKNGEPISYLFTFCDSMNNNEFALNALNGGGLQLLSEMTNHDYYPGQDIQTYDQLLEALGIEQPSPEQLSGKKIKRVASQTNNEVPAGESKGKYGAGFRTYPASQSLDAYNYTSNFTSFINAHLLNIGGYNIPYANVFDLNYSSSLYIYNNIFTDEQRALADRYFDDLYAKQRNSRAKEAIHDSAITMVFNKLSLEQMKAINQSPECSYAFDLSYDAIQRYESLKDIEDDQFINNKMGMLYSVKTLSKALSMGLIPNGEQWYEGLLNQFKSRCKDSAELGSWTSTYAISSLSLTYPGYNVNVVGDNIEFTQTSIKVIKEFLNSLKNREPNETEQRYLDMFGFTVNDNETAIAEKISAFCRSHGSTDGRTMSLESYYNAIAEVQNSNEMLTRECCENLFNSLFEIANDQLDFYQNGYLDTMGMYANTVDYKIDKNGNYIGAEWNSPKHFSGTVDERKARLQSAIEKNRATYNPEDFMDLPIYMVDIMADGTVNFNNKFKKALKTYLEKLCNISVRSADYIWQDSCNLDLSDFDSYDFDLFLHYCGLSKNDLKFDSIVWTYVDRQNNDPYSNNHTDNQAMIISEEMFDAISDAIINKLGAKDGMSFDEYYEMLVEQGLTSIESLGYRVNNYFGFDYVVSKEEYTASQIGATRHNAPQNNNVGTSSNEPVKTDGVNQSTPESNYDSSIKVERYNEFAVFNEYMSVNSADGVVATMPAESQEVYDYIQSLIIPIFEEYYQARYGNFSYMKYFTDGFSPNYEVFDDTYGVECKWKSEEAKQACFEAFQALVPQILEKYGDILTSLVYNGETFVFSTIYDNFECGNNHGHRVGLPADKGNMSKYHWVPLEQERTVDKPVSYINVEVIENNVPDKLPVDPAGKTVVRTAWDGICVSTDHTTLYVWDSKNQKYVAFPNYSDIESLQSGNIDALPWGRKFHNTAMDNNTINSMFISLINGFSRTSVDNIFVDKDGKYYMLDDDRLGMADHNFTNPYCFVEIEINSSTAAKMSAPSSYQQAFSNQEISSTEVTAQTNEVAGARNVEFEDEVPETETPAGGDDNYYISQWEDLYAELLNYLNLSSENLLNQRTVYGNLNSPYGSLENLRAHCEVMNRANVLKVQQNIDFGDDNLNNLISKLISGNLTDEEMRELNSIISSHYESRQTIIERNLLGGIYSNMKRSDLEAIAQKLCTGKYNTPIEEELAKELLSGEITDNNLIQSAISYLLDETSEKRLPRGFNQQELQAKVDEYLAKLEWQKDFNNKISMMFANRLEKAISGQQESVNTTNAPTDASNYVESANTTNVPTDASNYVESDTPTDAFMRTITLEEYQFLMSCSNESQLEGYFVRYDYFDNNGIRHQGFRKATLEDRGNNIYHIESTENAVFDDTIITAPHVKKCYYVQVEDATSITTKDDITINCPDYLKHRLYYLGGEGNPSETEKYGCFGYAGIDTMIQDLRSLKNEFKTKLTLDIDDKTFDELFERAMRVTISNINWDYIDTNFNGESPCINFEKVVKSLFEQINKMKSEANLGKKDFIFGEKFDEGGIALEIENKTYQVKDSRDEWFKKTQIFNDLMQYSDQMKSCFNHIYTFSELSHYGSFDNTFNECVVEVVNNLDLLNPISLESVLGKLEDAIKEYLDKQYEQLHSGSPYAYSRDFDKINGPFGEMTVGEYLYQYNCEFERYQQAFSNQEISSTEVTAQTNKVAGARNAEFEEETVDSDLDSQFNESLEIFVNELRGNSVQNGYKLAISPYYMDLPIIVNNDGNIDTNSLIAYMLKYVEQALPKNQTNSVLNRELSFDFINSLAVALDLSNNDNELTIRNKINSYFRANGGFEQNGNYTMDLKTLISALYKDEKCPVFKSGFDTKINYDKAIKTSGLSDFAFNLEDIPCHISDIYSYIDGSLKDDDSIWNVENNWNNFGSLIKNYKKAFDSILKAAGINDNDSIEVKKQKVKKLYDSLELSDTGLNTADGYKLYTYLLENGFVGEKEETVEVDAVDYWKYLKAFDSNVLGILEANQVDIDALIKAHPDDLGRLEELSIGLSLVFSDGTFVTLGYENYDGSFGLLHCKNKGEFLLECASRRNDLPDDYYNYVVSMYPELAEAFNNGNPFVKLSQNQYKLPTGNIMRNIGNGIYKDSTVSKSPLYIWTGAEYMEIPDDLFDENGNITDTYLKGEKSDYYAKLEEEQKVINGGYKKLETSGLYYKDGKIFAYCIESHEMYVVKENGNDYVVEYYRTGISLDKSEGTDEYTHVTFRGKDYYIPPMPENWSSVKTPAEEPAEETEIAGARTVIIEENKNQTQETKTEESDSVEESTEVKPDIESDVEILAEPEVLVDINTYEKQSEKEALKLGLSFDRKTRSFYKFQNGMRYNYIWNPYKNNEKGGFEIYVAGQVKPTQDKKTVLLQMILAARNQNLNFTTILGICRDSDGNYYDYNEKQKIYVRR